MPWVQPKEAAAALQRHGWSVEYLESKSVPGWVQWSGRVVQADAEAFINLLEFEDADAAEDAIPAECGTVVAREGPRVLQVIASRGADGMPLAGDLLSTTLGTATIRRRLEDAGWSEVEIEVRRDAQFRHLDVAAQKDDSALMITAMFTQRAPPSTTELIIRGGAAVAWTETFTLTVQVVSAAAAADVVAALRV